MDTSIGHTTVTTIVDIPVDMDVPTTTFMLSHTMDENLHCLQYCPMSWCDYTNTNWTMLLNIFQIIWNIQSTIKLNTCKFKFWYFNPRTPTLFLSPRTPKRGVGGIKSPPPFLVPYSLNHRSTNVVCMCWSTNYLWTCTIMYYMWLICLPCHGNHWYG